MAVVADHGVDASTFLHHVEYVHETHRNPSFVDKLIGTNLVIKWNIPILHTIRKHFVRVPSKADTDKIRNLQLPWKDGHFSMDEDEIIKKNWIDLCKEYNLIDDPYEFAQWRNVERNSEFSKIRRFIIMWLSRDLPYRLPSQVYHRFIHTLGCKSKGRFSEDEIEIIELFNSQKPSKYCTQQILGLILGRDEHSIWRYLTKHKNRSFGEIEFEKKTSWDLKMYEKFLHNLLNIVNEDENSLNIEVLRNKNISWKIWVEIGKRMSLKPLTAKARWNDKLYIQLFSPGPIFRRKILLKLIKTLHQRNYKHWIDIKWTDISSDFIGFTPSFLRKKFYFFALKSCPDKMKSLSDIIGFLHDSYIVKKYGIRNLQLRRLVLDGNGKLNIHPSDK